MACFQPVVEGQLADAVVVGSFGHDVLHQFQMEKLLKGVSLHQVLRMMLVLP